MPARARTKLTIRTKRAYEAPATGDGRRILIDRLWPRGVTKVQARIDYWARAISPSDALRKWYEHDPARWDEFKRRYFAELDANAEGVEVLREHLRVPATFVFGSREEKLNNAAALIEYLSARTAKRAAARKPVRARAGAKDGAERGLAWAAVRKLALAFPGMTEGTSYGEPAFLLDGKFFSRFYEQEQGLVVHAEEPLRDALLAGKPDVYFTTDHYRNYPAVLVRLACVPSAELAALYEAGFHARAKKKRVAEFDAQRNRK